MEHEGPKFSVHALFQIWFMMVTFLTGHRWSSIQFIHNQNIQCLTTRLTWRSVIHHHTVVGCGALDGRIARTRCACVAEGNALGAPEVSAATQTIRGEGGQGKAPLSTPVTACVSRPTRRRRKGGGELYSSDIVHRVLHQPRRVPTSQETALPASSRPCTKVMGKGRLTGHNVQVMIMIKAKIDPHACVRTVRPRNLPSQILSLGICCQEN